MKQWLGVGDPERRHKNEESRTSTRNEGPGTRILRLVNNNFESQNQEPKKEDKWITAESQESSLKDQESNQIPRNWLRDPETKGTKGTKGTKIQEAMTNIQ